MLAFGYVMQFKLRNAKSLLYST